MRTVMRSLLVGGVTILNWGHPALFAQQPAAGPAGYGFPAATSPAAPSPSAPSPSGGPQANLVWYDNVDMALRLAATQRKFVLIHFWNDNCPPCVAVEKAVLSRPEVQQAIGANFIPVKIKVDDQPDAARRFRVDRWPMDIVLSPEGTELYRNVSSQNPGQYTAILGRIATTARGAASAVQDVTRSANSWADRMAGAIPNFGAPPPTNAAPNAAPANAAAPTEPAGGSQFAAAPAAPPAPPAPTGAVANFQTAGSQGGAFNSRSSFQPDAAAPMDPPQIDMGNPMDAGSPAPSAPASPPAANRFGGGFAPGGGNAPAPTAPTFPPQDPPPAPRTPIAGIPASSRPQQPAAPVETAAQAPLGLDGFCPVTLQETRRWRRADARWGAIHRDRTYLFAGPEEQRRFLENPDRYAPMLSGYDPVRYLEQGQLVDGRRQHGVWFHNQMYLFADESSLERFWKNPDAVVPRVEQAMRANAATAGGNVRR